MGDEATAIAGDGTETVEVAGAGQTIADIVEESGLFGEGGTAEPTAPAPSTAKAGTGEGDSSKPKTDPAPAPAKPELFTEEQLGKLTRADIENPKFDWSKVPPPWQNVFKGWQADATRLNQQLAEARKAKPPERPKEPPQPTGEEQDPTEKANTEIVRKALETLGLNPEIVAEMAEDAIRTKGIALAVQSVPEYLADETVHAAVNLAIVQDPRLATFAESEDPQLIATAIHEGYLRVKNHALEGQVKAFRDREATITAKENEIKVGLEALKEERAKLNRGKSTVAGGSQQGGAPPPPAKDGAPAIREIVDDLPHFKDGQLQVG